jgi:protein-S-isoprenylcysteine O-methyltransferase Ste14
MPYHIAEGVLSMDKKTVAIEILPRALWLVKITLLIALHFIYGGGFSPSRSTDACMVGALILLMGILLGIWVLWHVFGALFTKKLITSGPYRFVRHPMYIAIYCILIGIAIIFSINIWFVVLALFIPLWYLVCRIEERQMLELHRFEYMDYQNRTGMFFPKLKRIKASS